MTLNAQARQLLELLERRGGTPAEASTVAQVRAANWDWIEFMGPVPPVARIDDTYIGGPSAELHVRCYTPPGEPPFPCIVFFHGGGFVGGNIALTDRPNRSLALVTGCVVVAVNYQKAPEHRFPTALDDCFATFQWVVGHAAELGVDPARIGVAGDSAGGNLAAAVTIRARDDGGPQPAFQILIYPALEPAMDSPSARANATGYGLTTAAMSWFWDHYVPDVERRDDPQAAPLRAEDLSGLPPAAVVTVEHDPLHDDGVRYAERLAAAGVTVVTHDYPGTIHGVLWMAGALTDDFDRLMSDVGGDVRVLLEPASAR